MFFNSKGVTRLIVLIVTQIIFWMSQDNYFPNIDTNIFKDSHVRFLDWLSNSISTSYANDTNHIVHINKRLRVVYVVHDVVPCTSGRNLHCVQGTTHKNMI